MDREVQKQPLSVPGWGGGPSSRHRPGQAKPTTRRVADRERMNPPGGRVARSRQCGRRRAPREPSNSRGFDLSQSSHRDAKDHRLTSSTDQPQRITLARFGPTGDMPGLKNGRSAEAHHTGAREPMRQAECSSQAQQRGDDEHQGDEHPENCPRRGCRPGPRVYGLAAPVFPPPCVLRGHGRCSPCTPSLAATAAARWVRKAGAGAPGWIGRRRRVPEMSPTCRQQPTTAASGNLRT